MRIPAWAAALAASIVVAWLGCSSSEPDDDDGAPTTTHSTTTTGSGGTGGSGGSGGSGNSAGQGGTAPGTDPCSGNSYTATTPTTAQGTAAPGSSSDQLAALALVDAFRQQIGLKPINFVAALNQSSQAHSDYCSGNQSCCPGWHDEVQNCGTGYTGASFGQRCAAAGYQGNPAFEVMAQAGSPQGAIDMWINSVYHRTPFISPKIHEAGYGGGTIYETMDFGCCGSADASLVTNYPVHGQTGFSTSFLGNEGPEPPPPPGNWPSGSIISVIFPPDATVSITAHELFDASCGAVAHMAGGADLPNGGTVQFELGFLGSSVVMYANKPLASGQTYTVNVEYTLNGTPGHRTFQFTTS
jgi:uncharacterized protein YkwD